MRHSRSWHEDVPFWDVQSPYASEAHRMSGEKTRTWVGLGTLPSSAQRSGGWWPPVSPQSSHTYLYAKLVAWQISLFLKRSLALLCRVTRGYVTVTPNIKSTRRRALKRVFKNRDIHTHQKPIGCQGKKSELGSLPS